MGIEAFDLLVHFDHTDITTVKNATEIDSIKDIVKQLINIRQEGILPEQTEVVISFRGKQIDDWSMTLGDLGITKEHTLDAKIVMK